MPTPMLPFRLPAYGVAPYVPTPGTQPQTYTARIGGQLVNVIAGTLKVANSIGQRSQGSMSVWGPLGVIWQYGTQVQVYDDAGALVYAGYVVKDKAYRAPGSRQGVGYLEHDVTLMDNCYRADKRRVFKSYLNAPAGAIVRDLLGSYLAAEGVTATATSIANGPTITEVIWSGTKSVSEALTWLCTQAGYWWQIDLNGLLYFQPYGGTPAPFTLDGTQADSLEDLYCEFGNDMYVNKQFAKGAFSETGVLTETFHGDGVRRNWTLSYPVARVTGRDKASGSILGVTLNGTAQPLGTKGADSGQAFYWAVGDAVLAQDTSRGVLQSTDTLIVTYKGRYPVLAAAQNPALIAAQRAREGGVTSGLVESTYTNTKVHTLPAAFQIASALLSHYGQDTTVLAFSTRQKGLQAGQMLTVNLPDFSLTGKRMLISDVTITDSVDGINIWYQVMAVGSPVESAQWQTYWQNLMNQSSDPTDFQDVSDTSLALLSSTALTSAPTFRTSQMKTVCPIIGPNTLIGPSMIVC